MILCKITAILTDTGISMVIRKREMKEGRKIFSDFFDGELYPEQIRKNELMKVKRLLPVNFPIERMGYIIFCEPHQIQDAKNALSLQFDNVLINIESQVKIFKRASKHILTNYKN